MNTKAIFAVLAAALVAAPLSAQIRPRTDQGRRTADGSIIRSDGTILRPDGSVVRTSDGSVTRGSSRVPPGHLPPRGMCRVWIDGVAPGQQPYGVTDCATARAQAAQTPNARVIYGDESAFPGRGKGRVGKTGANHCVSRESVVVNGRVVDVCRDANGNIIYPRNGRSGDDRVHRGDHDDDDERFDRRGHDDDDEWNDDGNKAQKREAKALKRANKEAAKASKKQEKRNRGKHDRDN